MIFKAHISVPFMKQEYIYPGTLPPSIIVHAKRLFDNMPNILEKI